MLDDQIRYDDTYIQVKETTIENLKEYKKKANVSKEDLYFYNKSLFNEYKTYISDSAIYYLNQNLGISTELQNLHKINETNILFASLFAALGEYKEALDAIAKINKDNMDEKQIVDYYLCYKNIYGGIAQYTRNPEERPNYLKLYKSYIDSLYLVLPPNSSEYLRLEEAECRERGKYDQALSFNDGRLELTKKETPEYALVMFHRSLIYRKMGEMEKQKESLIYSAMTDIQCAIKDNASISILATILFNEGDINRANNYIRFSLNNASIYRTRLRPSEMISIQTIIDKVYYEKNEQKKKELSIYLILIGTLSAILIVLVFYIYKQMKKKVKINEYIVKTNDELNILNQKLKTMNTKLEKINFEVLEANRIKEEYIGYFLNQCVAYIDKIDGYRKMVNKKLQERQIEELHKITRSNTLKEEEMKELFLNFDAMFLQLFPNFVENFNSLLMDDEQIVLRKGELLNTELRIHALIRLGINDSAKISSFLGYSVNTIYNYRAKMKNKTKFLREDFEWNVKRISSFNEKVT